MAGRKRTSVEEKKLKGTLQPCRVNPRMPKAAKGTPQPPAYLTARGKVHFKLLLSRLKVEQRLSASHTEVIGLAASRMAEVEDLAKEVKKVGYTYEAQTEFGVSIRANPAVAMLNVAKKDLRICLAELGLTPASVSKVGSSGDGGEDNDFAEFLQ